MTYERAPYIGLTQCLSCQSENINSILMLKINFPEDKLFELRNNETHKKRREYRIAMMFVYVFEVEELAHVL